MCCGSLLAAFGIFVAGGGFSLFEGVLALTRSHREDPLFAYAALGVAFGRGVGARVDLNDKVGASQAGDLADEIDARLSQELALEPYVFIDPTHPSARARSARRAVS